MRVPVLRDFAVNTEEFVKGRVDIFGFYAGIFAALPVNQTKNL